MYVEDAVSAQGPISLVVSPSITVAELKQQVEELVSQLDDLCCLYLDFLFDHLYLFIL